MAECELCKRSLGKKFLRLKHTCRLCSRTVCRDCSPNEVVLRDQKGKQRVCNSCVKNGISANSHDLEPRGAHSSWDAERAELAKRLGSGMKLIDGAVGAKQPHNELVERLEEAERALVATRGDRNSEAELALQLCNHFNELVVADFPEQPLPSSPNMEQAFRFCEDLSAQLSQRLKHLEQKANGAQVDASSLSVSERTRLLEDHSQLEGELCLESTSFNADERTHLLEDHSRLEGELFLESAARSEALESMARLEVSESTARSERVELELELQSCEEEKAELQAEMIEASKLLAKEKEISHTHAFSVHEANTTKMMLKAERISTERFEVEALEMQQLTALFEAETVNKREEVKVLLSEINESVLAEEQFEPERCLLRESMAQLRHQEPHDAGIAPDVTDTNGFGPDLAPIPDTAVTCPGERQHQEPHDAGIAPDVTDTSGFGLGMNDLESLERGVAASDGCQPDPIITSSLDSDFGLSAERKEGLSFALSLISHNDLIGKENQEFPVQMADDTGGVDVEPELAPISGKAETSLGERQDLPDEKPDQESLGESGLGLGMNDVELVEKGPASDLCPPDPIITSSPHYAFGLSEELKEELNFEHSLISDNDLSVKEKPRQMADDTGGVCVGPKFPSVSGTAETPPGERQDMPDEKPDQEPLDVSGLGLGMNDVELVEKGVPASDLCPPDPIITSSPDHAYGLSEELEEELNFEHSLISDNDQQVGIRSQEHVASTAREALDQELIIVANEHKATQALLKQENHLSFHAYAAPKNQIQRCTPEWEILVQRVIALNATLMQEQSARKKLEADTEADLAESKEAAADILRRLRVLGGCPTVSASEEAGNVADILMDCLQALTCAETASKEIQAAQPKRQQGGCTLL